MATVTGPHGEAGDRTTVLFVLECTACGKRDEHGLGWRAYLDVDDEVWIYCASCSERALGDNAGLED